MGINFYSAKPLILNKKTQIYIYKIILLNLCFIIAKLYYCVYVYHFKNNLKKKEKCLVTSLRKKYKLSKLTSRVLREGKNVYKFIFYYTYRELFDMNFEIKTGDA